MMKLQHLQFSLRIKDHLSVIVKLTKISLICCHPSGLLLLLLPQRQYQTMRSSRKAAYSV